ncbi:hypothetical protein L6452_01917 [Arctium lappa]|uniref:Uncharacterized protein n=1 Tax=Arctium lappa TaxID=4217 RepID=A0ACB9FIM0_ARCLA|nr:hypothetical protein L6452_01917 [Arctium lappa]
MALLEVHNYSVDDQINEMQLKANDAKEVIKTIVAKIYPTNIPPSVGKDKPTNDIQKTIVQETPEFGRTEPERNPNSDEDHPSTTLQIIGPIIFLVAANPELPVVPIITALTKTVISASNSEEPH